MTARLAGIILKPDKLLRLVLDTEDGNECVVVIANPGMDLELGRRLLITADGKLYYKGFELERRDI